jgi:serine/threonine protein kinase
MSPLLVAIESRASSAAAVGADGSAKITDFGIARSSHGTRLTEIGSLLGTAAYLSPEAAAGEEVTAAADIYGLGVVLYQMLTGSTPYSYETLTQLLVDQHHQPVPPIRDSAPQVAPALEEAVMRCLARLPEYRPPSAAALAADLERALAELSTQKIGARAASTAQTGRTRLAPVPARPERSDRSSFIQLGRKRIAIAAIALGLAVGLGVALLARDDSTRRGGANAPNGSAPAKTHKPAAQQARDLSAWLRAHTR